jgi:hypothetical protein
MAKRLQVILKDPEYREIQRMARSRHLSIAEWVRQALDLARRREPLGDVGKIRQLPFVKEASRVGLGFADFRQWNFLNRGNYREVVPCRLR